MKKKPAFLLCSMLDSWDNLIMNLSDVKSFDIDVVVASLLTEELKRKTNLNSHGDVMVMRGRPIDWDNSDRRKLRSKCKGKRKVKC